MEFEPKSERDLWEETILPTGEYDFEVTSAVAKQSKAGNDMIELTLSVFPNSDGSPRKVKDWLMAAVGFKLRHFCYATGLSQEYEEGTLTDMNCQGAAGRVKIGIEETASYGKQNRVKDYVVDVVDEQQSSAYDLPNDDPPPPVGVPKAQTKRANKAKQTQEVSAPHEDDCPF